MSTNGKPQLRKFTTIKASPKTKGKPKFNKRGVISGIPEPSPKQLEIIRSIENGDDVNYLGVPGCGKTTLCFQIARYFPGLSICMLTFNKSLKFEVRKKADIYKIPSLESGNVHSYHSFAKKMYNEPLAHSDDGIRLILETNREPAHNMAYDMIIVDESQDMRSLLAVFILKVLRDTENFMGARPILIKLGDHRQGVYEFLGSRAHFLTHAHLIYREHNFTTHEYNMSYRLTNQIGTFLNKVILGKDEIKTDKEGPKVGFITTSNFNKVGLAHAILGCIWKYKKEYNLHDDDVLIIAHTLYNNRGMKGNHEVVHILENKLTQYNHKVYYPSSDDTEIESQSTAGRILFATQPQSKGLERKLVICLDINGFWSNLQGEEANKTVVPSAVFVALSRASQKLIIVSNDEVPPYFKIPRSTLFNTEFSMLEDEQDPIPDKKYVYEPPKMPSVSVVRLCRYLPERMQKELELDIAPMYKETAPETKTIIKIPSNIKITRNYATTDGVVHTYYTYEYVADKTGNALLHLYDMVNKKEGKQTWLEEQIAKLLAEPESNPHRQLLILNNSHPDPEDPDNPSKFVVTLSNIDEIVSASSIIDHYERNTVSSPTMLNRFDWIKQAQAQLAVTRLENVLGDSAQREVALRCDIELEENSELTTLVGRVDAIANGTLWEIKCKEKIDIESKLQLLVYSKLWQINFPDNPIRFKLYNIKTGQEFEFFPNDAIVMEVLNKLVENLRSNDEVEPPEETARQVHAHWERVKNIDPDSSTSASKSVSNGKSATTSNGKSATNGTHSNGTSHSNGKSTSSGKK